MPQQPVIFLAFANEQPNGIQYLSYLAQEERVIREALEKAATEKICEVVYESHAGIDTIVNTFQKYEGRIAIFHYAGHANSYQLLLQGRNGKNELAYAEGLVSFLAKQQGLQLVFLNGCSSQQQAMQLIEAGIPVVVGTKQSINDTAAMQIAERFYRALGYGLPIGQSWQQAEDRLLIEHGGNVRDLYFEGLEEINQAKSFPWQLNSRAGASEVLDWNLPQACQQPLFGLPKLPARLLQSLPQMPYRYLKPYTDKEAAIFFGRSSYIRDLYLRIADEKGSPVILLYGQSGVGKSSLLHAGLFPRLIQDYEVKYLRRNPDTGLAGTLVEALPMEENAPKAPTLPTTTAEDHTTTIIALEALATNAPPALKLELQLTIKRLRAMNFNRHTEEESVHEPSLLQNWHRLESAPGGKARVIIIDQLEEAITKQLNGQTAAATQTLSGEGEIRSFAEQLQSIFAQGHQWPKGKIVLSFRKEYLPEVENALSHFHVPYQSVYIQRLNEQDIAEVIAGLRSNERLRRFYPLEAIEKGLPAHIASHLLKTQSQGALAPVLQILLTKMWETAVEQNGKRVFDQTLFKKLTTDGIMLQDFVKEQLAKLQEVDAGRFAKAVTSGLVLEILHDHTTNLATAGNCAYATLQKQYPQVVQSNGDMPLLTAITNTFLLTSTGGKSTALGHDTLAPIIRKMHEESGQAGPRASRILIAKTNQAKGIAQAGLLTEQELDWVEKGQHGMKKWEDATQKLVADSQKKYAQAKRNKRIMQGGLGLAAFMIIAFGIYSWLLKGDVKEREIRLGKKQLELDSSQNRLDKTMLALQDSTTKIQEKESELMLQDSQLALKGDSIQQVLKDVEASFWAGNSLKNADPNAQWAQAKKAYQFNRNNLQAQEALLTASYQALPYKELGSHEQTIRDLATHPSGSIATASNDQTIWVFRQGKKPWHIAKSNVLGEDSHNQAVVKLSFDATGTLLASASEDNTVKVWSLTQQKRKGQAIPVDAPEALTFLSNGYLQVTGRLGTKTFAYEQGAWQEKACTSDCKPVDFPTASEGWQLKNHALLYRQDTAMLLRGPANDPLMTSKLLGNKAVGFTQEGKILSWDLTSIQKNWATVDAHKILWAGRQLWWVKTADGTLFNTSQASIAYETPWQEKQWKASTQNSYLLGISEEDIIDYSFKAAVWDAKGKELWTERFAEAQSIAFDEKHQQVAVASGNTLVLWDVEADKKLYTLQHQSQVAHVSYVAGYWLAITTGGQLHWWKEAEKVMSMPTHQDVQLVQTDGRQVAIASAKGIQIWQALAKKASRLVVFTDAKGMAFIGQEKIAIWSKRHLQVWNIPSNSLVLSLPIAGGIKTAAFNGRALIIVSANGNKHEVALDAKEVF